MPKWTDVISVDWKSIDSVSDGIPCGGQGRGPSAVMMNPESIADNTQNETIFDHLRQNSWQIVSC